MYRGDGYYDVEGTAAFVCSRGLARVALQFPDHLLGDAASVVSSLKTACAQNGHEGVELFVLADTTFGSCCVDEVAAQHVNADAVVHFGSACLSPVSHLPAKFVFGSEPIDVGECASSIAALAADVGEGRAVLVAYDLEYAASMDTIEAAVKESCADGPLVVAQVQADVLEPGVATSGGAIGAGRMSLGGLTWDLPDGVGIGDVACVWVGREGPPLTNMMMTFNTAGSWARYDPTRPEGRRWSEGASVSRDLKRRYYLVERAKDASIVGVVVGTLGVAGYAEVLMRIRQLAKAAGKKTYTMVMGRINPAKLANFPEVDTFVMVACAQTALLDSKEFMAPVITPFEAELALRGRQWTGEYALDFGAVLAGAAAEGEGPGGAPPEDAGDEPRYSFVKGRFVGGGGGDVAGEEAEGDESSALALRTSRALQVSGGAGGGGAEPQSAAEYLAWKRTYGGLEAPGQEAEDAPVTAAVPGRTGRAAVYVDEPEKEEEGREG